MPRWVQITLPDGRPDQHRRIGLPPLIPTTLALALALGRSLPSPPFLLPLPLRPTISLTPSSVFLPTPEAIPPAPLLKRVRNRRFRRRTPTIYFKKIKKLTLINRQKQIVNLSNYSFSNAEQSLLNKGLNFIPTPWNLPDLEGPTPETSEYRTNLETPNNQPTGDALFSREPARGLPHQLAKQWKHTSTTSKPN